MLEEVRQQISQESVEIKRELKAPTLLESFNDVKLALNGDSVLLYKKHFYEFKTVEQFGLMF